MLFVKFIFENWEFLISIYIYDQGPEKSTLDFTLIDFLIQLKKISRKQSMFQAQNVDALNVRNWKIWKTSGFWRWGLSMGSQDSMEGMKLREKPGPIGILVKWTVFIFLGGVDLPSTPCCDYSSVSCKGCSRKVFFLGHLLHTLAGFYVIPF